MLRWPLAIESLLLAVDVIPLQVKSTQRGAVVRVRIDLVVLIYSSMPLIYVARDFVAPPHSLMHLP